MSEIGVHLPNMGNMQEAHLQMKLIRDILANKERVDALMEFSTPPAPPLLTPNSIPKLENQGKFTLPCTLGDLKLEDALVDTGASVNLISLAMVKRLGIKSMTSRTSYIMFGDASSKSPLGLMMGIILFPISIPDSASAQIESSNGLSNIRSR
uniref:Aspartic peptidase DDI1-type domain-containing protein n=1 Tax=Noccaea caerulescens TaxID=107243 RepID=A0A1J3K1X8_NOCCA